MHIGDTVIRGQAVDIDENANLLVKDTQGKMHLFNSGEVRVRAKK